VCDKISEGRDMGIAFAAVTMRVVTIFVMRSVSPLSYNIG